MDFNTLIEIIEEAGYSAYSYSGRNMYGASCVGFTTDDNEFVTAANIFDSAKSWDDGSWNIIEPVLDILRGAKTDSMGLSTVVYFPRVTWEGE